MPAALRVARRHRTGWSPLQLPDLVAWYNASHIVGLNDGDVVATWSDSSGNGHTLTKGAASQPLYKTSIVNNQSVVRFPVAGTANSFLASSNFGLVKPFTILLPFNFRTSAVNQQDITDGLTGATAIIGPVSAAQFQLWGGTGAVGATAISAATWYVGAAAFASSGNSSVYLNDSAAPTSGDAGTRAIGGGFALGARADGTFNAGIDTPEVIVVGGAITQASLHAAFVYFSSRFGLSAS